MVQSKNKKDYALPHWFYIVILLILVSIVLFWLYASGFLRYATSYAGCGFKQPIYAYSTSGIAGAKVELFYAFPNEEDYKSAAGEIGLFGTHEYYCSEQDAVKNGYHRPSSE